MTDWQRLTEAIPPPPSGGGGTPADWGTFETLVGTRLPEDYKRFVETYGSGRIGDFLTVFVPESEHEFLQLTTRLEMASDTLEFLKEFEEIGGETIPYDVAELLPVAGTDNGDTVYWLRRPLDSPDSWSIVVNEARGDRWDQFEGGIVAFLVAVFVDRRPVPMFPESLYRRPASFVSTS